MKEVIRQLNLEIYERKSCQQNLEIYERNHT